MSDVFFYTILFVFAVFVVSCSQILLKLAANKSYKNKQAEYLNWRVIAAYGMMGATFIVSMYVLRYISLSLVTILESATYVFVPVLSRIFLGEKLGKNQVIGMFLIITGIVIFNL